MPSPKLEPVVLTGEERQVLEGWARRRKTAQALALRSRIILACADGAPISEVAAELGVSRTTVNRMLLRGELHWVDEDGFRLVTSESLRAAQERMRRLIKLGRR